MKTRWAGILLTSLAVSACNGSDGNGVGDNLPSQAFAELDNYQLADFKLDGDYTYWEVRQDQSLFDEPSRVLYAYDADVRQQLAGSQQEQLRQTSSQSGFHSACEPSYCAIYGVAVEPESTRLITSKNELLGLFDSIDTEAELNLWLWANGYEGQTYEEVAGGYRAAGYWNNLCQKSGEDLLFVDANGTITVEREISRETDPNAPCV